jgi:hypothetical protein
MYALMMIWWKIRNTTHYDHGDDNCYRIHGYFNLVNTQQICSTVLHVWNLNVQLKYLTTHTHTM